MKNISSKASPITTAKACQARIFLFSKVKHITGRKMVTFELINHVSFVIQVLLPNNESNPYLNKKSKKKII
jgi:uncharacterized membrane protein